MAEVKFQPAWLTYEIEAALRRIRGQHARKKRTTILRLAEGMVLGRPVTETFALDDTCSETTWYGRYEGGEKKPGWRDDPLIQHALKLANNRAQYCSDSYMADQIKETQKVLAMYGPGAAHKLGQLMVGAQSENIQRLTSLDILDRQGGGETASKGTVPPVSGEPLVIVHLPDNERGDRDTAPTQASDLSGDAG